MKRSLIVMTLIASLAATAFFASTARSSEARPASNPQAALAPDFEVKDLTGRTIRLSDLRGKAVVINFWATWCPPCRHEIPRFIDLQKKYGPKGLQIVGLSADSAGSKRNMAI